MNIFYFIKRIDFNTFNINILKLELKHLFKFICGLNEFKIHEFGVDFIVRPRTSDLYVIGEVFGDNTYKLNQIKKGDKIGTYLDLGANIGVSSLWFNKNYNPSKMILVEMDQDTIKLLKKNLDSNKITNSTIINKAVYSKTKKIFFEKVPGNSGMNFITHTTTKNAVDTITLKEIFDSNKLSRVDILKVDIEGSEKYVFTDENKDIFLKKVKYVVMEFHKFKNNYPESYYLDYLHSLGFKNTTTRPLYSLTSIITAVNATI